MNSERTALKDMETEVTNVPATSDAHENSKVPVIWLTGDI